MTASGQDDLSSVRCSSSANEVVPPALKTMYPRPRLILCISDSEAAAPFQSPSRSCGAQALQDIGIEVSLVDLPDDVRAAVGEAQIHQHR